MSFTLTLAWWHIPAVVTAVAALWTSFGPAGESGYFGELFNRMFMAIPALMVSLIAWAVAGFFK